MRKQLWDGVNTKRSYWKLKEEILDPTVWRNGFGKKLMDLSQDRLCTITNHLTLVRLVSREKIQT